MRGFILTKRSKRQIAREIIESLRRELQRPRRADLVRDGESTLPERANVNHAAQTTNGSLPVTGLQRGMKAVEDVAA